MNAIVIDPVYVEIGAPALLIGLVLGALIAWLVGRSRRKRAAASFEQLETRIKDQDAIQLERDSAYEAATSRLMGEFSELANKSLKSNSENFLRLAEQNLSAHQEKANRALGDREQAVENLVKPIREALKESQQQIAELEKSRSEAYGGIRSQLETMQLSHKSLAQETKNLVNAQPGLQRLGQLGLRNL